MGHKSRVYKKGEIVKLVLKTLAGIGFVMVLPALPGIAHIVKLFDTDSEKDRRKIVRTVKRLEEQNVIRLYSKDGKDYIEVTEKGRRKLLEFDFYDMQIKQPKKWDKKWRLVTFDIPERLVVARKTLSWKLKDMGFHQLQRSVFIYPYECRSEISFIKSYFLIDRFVDYLEVSYIETTTDLHKIFGL